jgi:PTH1 family peptidyl-tRNA hydrolase
LLSRLKNILSAKKDTPMWLFAGLGNPGDKYANNRHNIGFLAIDEIADRYGFPPFRSKFQGQVSEGKIGGKKIVLLKPQTYMNNSGQSVAPAAKFYKLPPEQIIVFYDEIELEPGKIRVKQGGGNAGHNGLRSMDDHLPSKEYWRVRMGVGRPEHGDVADYVLGNFSKGVEKNLANELVKNAAEHVALLLEEKDSEFMNKVVLAGRAEKKE